MSPITASLLFLLLGLIVGALSAWMIARFKFSASMIAKEELDKLYVLKQLYVDLQQQQQTLLEQVKLKDDMRIELEKLVTSQERDLDYMKERVKQWSIEFEEQRVLARTEFENIANKLLQEKTEKFSVQNEKKITDLLQPFHQKIREFGVDISRHFSEEAKDVVSLKKEIEYLKVMNLQISTDAQNLAAALKGDSKMQGDWGEFQLELVLEKAGLQKDIHYKVQPSFKDADGQDKRPDFIIHLPEGRHLILDSKVSLKAYEKFYNADTELIKAKHLKEHVDSLRSHIRDLNSKNYQHLYQINCPDYLLLYVPIEPALWAAIHKDDKLYLEALDKNIILVSTSTLLATMRTVSFIWQQDRQSKNVQEIARQSGLLYDKFVGFVDDLKEIGMRMQHAQTAYNSAMNKLSDSRKYGDTLIGRAEKIKELGAKSSKSLPPELLLPGEEENGLLLSES